ncbi:PapB/FocB family fimbrial expression transcriptional regulator [Pseudomonas sp. EMN2]|uniref:PapB/FocB family fimbrial expression transcriptional regulator n=1 Tax=Pseudomonas sp. EMN2 TaxID=2615212 RepID=UPI00129B52F7|nr:PapB/FocB family fimbrial expression transcriptional regulator [Pseudomonas sp. EMN2]
MSENEAPPLAAPLTPGSITADHLDGLVAGTGIKGKEAIQALHDHLVKSEPAAAVIARAGFTKAHFYSRVKIIEKAHQYAARMSQYYEPTAEGVRVRPVTTQG